MESNTNLNSSWQESIQAGFCFDVGSLYSYLEKLTDKRKAKGLRYRLATVLVLIMLAKFSGEDNPSGIADWAKNRTDMLVEALQLEYAKMPHHSTYRRILEECVEIEELEALVRAYLTSRPKAGRSVVVAIDGKTVRGTIDEQQGLKGVHLLAAYLPAEGVVLAQVAVDCKENEIVAAPQVLKHLDLRGKVVIGDAMHTQRKISVQIVTSGGDYVWLVKHNHPRLRWDLEQLFKPQKPIPGVGNPPMDFRTARTVNKGHGRIEERQITVSNMLKDYVDWPYLQQVFRLERRFTYLKSGKVKHEVVYGISSLSNRKAAPKRILEIVRQFWGIENGLHYRRDVTFQEDVTRLTKGKAGHAMAVINNLVVGMLAQNGYKNMAKARRYFDANPLKALDLISRL